MFKKKTKLIMFLALAGGLGVAVFFWFRAGVGLSGGSVSFSAPANYAESLLISAADFSLSIKPVGASPSSLPLPEGENKRGWERFGSFLKLSENKIRYPDAYAEADVVQTVQGGGIKEEIILRAPGHPAEFRYLINAADFLAQKDEQGNLQFYKKERNADGGADDLKRLFTIPAPFMIDAAGVRSGTADVEMSLKDDLLTIQPSAAWLASHQYPIVLDPSVEIAVLNVHSHPLQGENWEVSFITQGTADLTISPNDVATVEDDEFVSLTCDNEPRTPEIRAGDVIFYANWSCAGTGKVVHKTLVAGDHTLKFQFGDEISYAYNNFSGDRRYAWGENIGWLNASSTYESLTVAPAGLTGYIWGENIGWIKMDYDGIAGATNTTATDWGVTNDSFGHLGGYAWGENVGWLNFHPTHSQVTIDMENSADFDGYAWGENIGWVNFGHNLSSYVPRFITEPLAVTLPASNIASKVVTANGRIYLAGATSTVRGFKYGLTETDTWTVSESGSYPGGEFKLAIPDLIPNTTYYIRAYLTTAEGTGYGSYVAFTTETSQKGSPIIFKENVILKEGVIVR